MQFMYTKSWLLHRCSQYNLRSLYLLSFTIPILLTALWCWVINPMLDSVYSYYESMLLQQQEHYNALAGQKERYTALEETYSKSQEYLKKIIHEYYMPTSTAEEYMFSIFNQLSIKLRSYNPGTIINKDWYNKQTIYYSMTTSFENLIAWLHSLHNSNRLIMCKNTAITSIGPNKLDCNVTCILISIVKV